MGLDNFLLAADIDNFDPNVCVFSQTCGLIGRQGRIITYILVTFLIVNGQGKVKKHCKTYVFVNEAFVTVL